MKRIVVIGCAGSGKSFVARHLGATLRLPVIHLDDIYFDAAWNPLPSDEFGAEQARVVRAAEWIIDGNYISTMPIRLAAADTIIVMDVSTIAALHGVVQRWWKHGSGQHGDGVHVRISVDLLRYVVSFRRRMRPRVLAAIAAHTDHAEVCVLRNRRAARHMLAVVAAESGGDHQSR